MRKDAKFAKLEMAMVYSAAYQDLNTPGFRILAYVLLQLRWVKVSSRKQRNHYELSNKDDIPLLYSTFNKKPFSMGNQTITRGIDSLLSHGFIKVQSQGGLCRGHKSTFGYSEAWRNWKPGDICASRSPYHAERFR